MMLKTQFFALLSLVAITEVAPKSVTEADTEPELRSCHGSDYLKCAFVIAGCASSCSSSNVRKYVQHQRIYIATV